MDKLIQLYPDYRPLDSIKGLYLDEIPQGETAEDKRRTMVYANFLTSLDGRIAVRGEHGGELPDGLTNDHDFRLLIELQAQADCLITHGGYLRDRADGKLGDVLHLASHRRHRDLLEWRRQRSLPDDFMIAVCSTSLDFPEPKDLDREKVCVVASEQSRPDRIRAWRNKGYRVEIGGERQVEGGRLIAILENSGQRNVFLAGGPKLLSSLLKDRRLNRLYLTLSHQLIGTTDFYTMTEGSDAVFKHCRLHQSRLIHDASDSLRHGQWYARFDVDYG